MPNSNIRINSITEKDTNQSVEVSKLAPIGVADGAVIYVDTVADLQALDTSGLVVGQAASVQGSEFRWDGGEWRPVGAVSVRAFGAVGDGEADDHKAIVDALNMLSGQQLLLDGGKKYLIESPIVYNGDVSISTSGEGKATIFHDGQSFDPVTFQGVHVKTVQLSSSQQMQNRVWEVDDSSLIEPGMIVEIVSNKSWYHDPRPESTDARKSELHKVLSVEAGSFATFDPANDGYDLSEESVEVRIYRPISLRLDRLAIECVQPEPQEGAPRVVGLSVRYCDSGVINEVDTFKCLSNGIQLRGCYATHVEKGTSKTSNHFSNGYGVGIFGSSHCRVSYRHFTECRRGVDISGFNVVSRHCVVENCVNSGGGVNSEGTVYGWTEGASVGAPQFGFGSHGPSDGAIYRGNIVFNMHNAFNVRGRNELIERNTVVGRTRFGTIELVYGENVTIKNNRVVSDWYSSFKNDSLLEGGANKNTRRAQYFVRLQDSYQGGKVYITDNIAEIQDVFLFVMDEGITSDVVIQNNLVEFSPQFSSNVAYLASHDGSEVSPNRWALINNRLRRVSGTGGAQLLDNIKDNPSWSIVSGSSYSGEYTPEVTVVSNANSGFAQTCRFFVLDDVVTVSGTLVLDTDTSSTASFNLSLPIDTSMPSAHNLSLTGSSHNFGSKANVNASGLAATDKALVRLTPTTEGEYTIVFTMTYLIR